MTANPLQFNKFEMKSNVDDTTVDLRGSGTPIIEYRESIFIAMSKFFNRTRSLRNNWFNLKRYN